MAILATPRRGDNPVAELRRARGELDRMIAEALASLDEMLELRGRFDRALLAERRRRRGARR